MTYAVCFYENEQIIYLYCEQVDHAGVHFHVHAMASMPLKECITSTCYDFFCNNIYSKKTQIKNREYAFIGCWNQSWSLVFGS